MHSHKIVTCDFDITSILLFTLSKVVVFHGIMCKTVKYYNNLDGNESIFKWINIFLFLSFLYLVFLLIYKCMQHLHVENSITYLCLFLCFQGFIMKLSHTRNRCYMPQGATGFTNNKPNRLYKK